MMAPTFVKRQLTKRNVKKALKFFSEAASIAMDLRDEPTTLDYVATGLRLTGLLTGSDNDSDDYFEDWKYQSFRGMSNALIELLSLADDVKCVRAEKGSKTMVATIDGIKFGWKRYGGGEWSSSTEGPYIEEHVDAAVVLPTLKRYFWERMKTDHVKLTSVGTLSMGYTMVFKIDDSDDVSDAHMPAVCRTIMQNLVKFDSKNIARSLLFVGPPGTGKSTVIRLIAHTLAKRSLRISVSELIKNDINMIIAAIEVFEPEVIIIDDLDRLHDPKALLDGMERFRAKTGIVLASMNSTKNCDRALIRPGRFDQVENIVSIDEAIVAKYINADDKHYDAIKLWPIAYIREYCNNRDVLGTEFDADALFEKLDARQRLDDEQCSEDDEEDDEATSRDEKPSCTDAPPASIFD